MLVYLDMCCFNRPFDDQTHPQVQLETEGKLLLQQKIRNDEIKIAWSYMLDYENSANPDTDISATIVAWEKRASVVIEPGQVIVDRANEIRSLGIDPKDALHISCPIEARADCFITVDRGILKHRNKISIIEIKSPLEYFY